MAVEKRLASALLDARLFIDPQRYIYLSALGSGIIILLFLPLLPIYQLPILFILLFSVSLLLPSMLANRRARKLEAELPLFLRSLSTELMAGIGFEDALRDSASMGKETSMIVREILHMQREGIPMERAIKEVGKRIRSPLVHRALRHISVVYTTGKGAEALQKLADELLSIQKAKARQYAAKVAMSALLFSASSALVPALFEMYVLLGSLIMEIGLSPQQIFTLSAIVFPSVSALVLLSIYLKAPTLVG